MDEQQIATICMLPDKVCRTVCRCVWNDRIVYFCNCKWSFHSFSRSSTEVRPKTRNNFLFIYCGFRLFNSNSDRLHLCNHLEFTKSTESCGNETCSKKRMREMISRVCMKHKEEVIWVINKNNKWVEWRMDWDVWICLFWNWMRH